MNPKDESLLGETVTALRGQLGENLFSCCVYGSVVRGNAIQGVSDVNLLIVLGESDSAAHEKVALVLKERANIDPFVLGRRGFERNVRAFAPKFASIRRNYRVLHGADPLAAMTIDPRHERFLCEQAVRNLRLRLVHAFVTRNERRSYAQFVVRNVTAVFVQFSEVLRLHGVAMPADFVARVPVLAREFAVDAQVLTDLLALKREPRRCHDDDEIGWHRRLLPAVEAVVRWIEAHWTA